jgi:hypothetical protein
VALGATGVNSSVWPRRVAQHDLRPQKLLQQILHHVMQEAAGRTLPNTP